MEKSERELKPRQYSHIDYEALLIYAMKRHISVEKSIEENGLTIAKSTVVRNIRKIKQEKDRDLSVIEFYQNVHTPNFQKPEMPEYIK